jgi:hypothetical protein
VPERGLGNTCCFHWYRVKAISRHADCASPLACRHLAFLPVCLSCEFANRIQFGISTAASRPAVSVTNPVTGETLVVEMSDHAIEMVALHEWANAAESDVRGRCSW